MKGAVVFRDLWKVLFGGILYQLFRLAIVQTTKPFVEHFCKERFDLEKRMRYIEKGTSNIFKFWFHLTAFIWGWLVLKEIGWLPSCLGGTGTIDELWSTLMPQNFPFGSPPKAIVTYGLYTSGYHASELIRHLFSERKQDFEETTVHHIVTITLYLGYFLSNLHVVGAFIAVLHDFSDVLICCSRIL